MPVPPLIPSSPPCAGISPEVSSMPAMEGQGYSRLRGHPNVTLCSPCTPRQPRNGVYLEEGHAGAAVDGAVLDGGLVSEVIHGLDGHIHALHGQERGQVGRVGGDDDQGEGPPREREEKVWFPSGNLLSIPQSLPLRIPQSLRLQNPSKSINPHFVTQTSECHIQSSLNTSTTSLGSPPNVPQPFP